VQKEKELLERVGKAAPWAAAGMCTSISHEQSRQQRQDCCTCIAINPLAVCVPWPLGAGPPRRFGAASSWHPRRTCCGWRRRGPRGDGRRRSAVE
jgi:hypothetical protein